MSKNPSWIADELILALDLYFKVNVIKTSAQHPLIVNLSKLLRSLPLHDLGNVGENFRSPSSVYMKLSNFLRIDPTYSGRGLDAGSKLDIEIWNEYSGDLDRLRKIANAIYHNINAPNSHLEEKIFTGEDEESVFLEGKIIS
ncbi:MAG: HNH endonuclease, partial [Anaerolineae bacterium]|nr:HNH endonuclease [Anaerolineae bacterium]